MFNNSTTFVGLDLGDKYSYLIILDQDAEVIEETRLRTSKSAFQRKFTSFPASRIAMEVGTHSRWVSHFNKIRNYAHSRVEILVANQRNKSRSYGWHVVAYLSSDNLGVIKLNWSVVAPRPNLPWRGKPNAAGEGRR